MNDKFVRSALVFGEDGIEKLNNASVAIFGLGGVGSYVVEGLARAGVGKFTLVDNDMYGLSNFNRQLYATSGSVGKLKTAVAKDRILSINEAAVVTEVNAFITEREPLDLDFSAFDYVVDAIDTISGKVEIIMRSKAAGVKVISSMATGNKLNPAAFKVADIYSTKNCPLSRVMRKLLRERGVDNLKVVYSEESPISAREDMLIKYGEKKGNGYAPASVSFVPSVAGLIIAGEVVKDIVGVK